MFLTKKIPYYGKYNSISSICLSADELTYIVKRFDSKGKEKSETFEIPKKNKNTEALIKDYFNNVEEYLKKNKDQYLDYKKEKINIKKDFDITKINKLKNLSKTSLALSIIIILLAFLLTSSVIAYYIGFVLLIPSSTGLFLLTDISKELNIKNFINDYEEFEQNLTEYKTGIETQNKKSLTEYNGLNKDKNKGNDLKLKKIRTLESKVA